MWWSCDGIDSGRIVGVGGNVWERRVYSVSCEVFGSDLLKLGVFFVSDWSEDMFLNCDFFFGVYW